MFVKFIKKCLWSIDGRVKTFNVDNIKDIKEQDAKDMIKYGYAVAYQQKQTPNIIKSNHWKTEKLADKDRARRSIFYKVKFSLPALKQFCKNNGVIIKTNIHRTKSMIIEEILDFEKERGLIKEKNV